MVTDFDGSWMRHDGKWRVRLVPKRKGRLPPIGSVVRVVVERKPPAKPEKLDVRITGCLTSDKGTKYGLLADPT